MMFGTSRPTIASALSASKPKICGIQNVSKPSSAAAPAASTIASTGPPATSPPKSPMCTPYLRLDASCDSVDPGRRDEHGGAALVGHDPVVLVPVVVRAAG